MGDSRGGRTWQISLSSCQFCCEPKTALKHLSCLKKKEKKSGFQTGMHKTSIEFKKTQESGV